MSSSTVNIPSGVGYNLLMFDASNTATSGSAFKEFSVISRLFCVKYVSAFILVLFFARAPGTQAQTLLILGDSLSAGYGIARNDAWPSLLQEKLSSNGNQSRVVNASISGDTTRGGLNRLQRLLNKHKPDVVMVELGANDGLRGIPAEHARENLVSIIDKSKAVGAKVLLFEMKIPPNYGQVFSDQYQAVYDQLGSVDQVTLVPFFLADVIFKPNMMQADGLHPTAAAQPLLLEHVWPYVDLALSDSTLRKTSDPGALEIDELSPY